ncbi:MAG TPA: hypothetical protein ENK19_00130, partial [Acidobacteria bacterium]|nr:hypothetical protein [Acidobacteriota bacterium]
MKRTLRSLLAVAVAVLSAGNAVAGASAAAPVAVTGPGGIPALSVPTAARPGAVVIVELLDTDDALRAVTRRPAGVGRPAVLVPLSFLGDLPPRLQEELTLLRLRVSLIAGGHVLARWIVPCSRLPGAFELRVVDPEVVTSGRRIPVFVRATDAASGAAAPGVPVTVRLGDVTVRGRT